MVESRQTIRNWRAQSQQYFCEGRYQDYHSVLEKISIVMDLRRQLAAKEIDDDDVGLEACVDYLMQFKLESEACGYSRDRRSS